MIHTWLFTWNPERWAWDNRLTGYAETKHEIDTIGFSFVRWTCGVNKSIKPGDRIFLIRLGNEPRGIVASGYALSCVFEGVHWDEERAALGKQAKRIFLKLDKMADTNFDNILRMERLKNISSTFTWSSQMSGICIHNDIAKALESEWEKL